MSLHILCFFWFLTSVSAQAAFSSSQRIHLVQEGEVIVLDAKKVKKATEEILTRYGIERDRSMDLK